MKRTHLAMPNTKLSLKALLWTLPLLTLGAIVISFAIPCSVHAQAWVPPKGSLLLGATYRFDYSTSLVEDEHSLSLIHI